MKEINMTLYALVNDNNVVVDVKGGDAEWLAYQDGNWIETCPDTSGGVHRFGGTPLRKNFAQIGFWYDSTLDAFIPPKPAYDSWVVDSVTGQWVPPVAYPTDTNIFVWNETQQKFDTFISQQAEGSQDS